MQGNVKIFPGWKILFFFYFKIAKIILLLLQSFPPAQGKKMFLSGLTSTGIKHP